MLYDPKWEKPEVKADPFSLESLIAWLEKMPAAGKYCYFDHGGCLMHKYLTAAGLAPIWIGGLSYKLADRKHRHLPEAFADIAAETGHTFGAALTRAREALASRA